MVVLHECLPHIINSPVEELPSWADNPFFTEPSCYCSVLERPCDALIVEVTGVSAEYAKPPVNPIKWRELPVVWGESAICFQDLSTRRSKVTPLLVGPHL